MKWLAILSLVSEGCFQPEDATDSTAQASQHPIIPIIEISAAVQYDISRPLREMPGAPAVKKYEGPLRKIRPQGPDLDDTVVQGAPLAPTPKIAVTTGLNFAGIGNGDYGFAPDSAPPDTNGVAGGFQYVQWVNESFAVFDKFTGAITPGFPIRGNTIWTGFGGACETNNDGDPIVQYDKLASRWILTQFSVSTTPFLQCVAVSTTSDATGSYARYAFSYANFPDYPKLAVWPEAYFISFNSFNITSDAFMGAMACAYDRIAMLAGAPATQICFQQPNTVASLLPSDLDGTTPPPPGSPNFFVTLQTTTSLNLFKFSMFGFSGPVTIPIASYTPACSGGTCIPQPGTTQKLDSLSDRLMYRAAYRNFGDHESLLLTHSIAGPGGRSGIRWYELRRTPSGTDPFSVFQQGSFAPPDGLFRWMPSIAMDQRGNIAVCYSVSSSTIFPGIRCAARAPTDASGTFSSEFVLQNGAGSQLTGLSRWGDYSALTIDPVDDCTFWFTSEYLKANGTFNWSTKIASFKLAGCP